MSRVVWCASLIALSVAGCAASTETERRADIHDYRARRAAQYEDYDRAAAEKREADRLHAKAARERSEEATPGEAAVPPVHDDETVPVPAPPASPPPPAP